MSWIGLDGRSNIGASRLLSNNGQQEKGYFLVLLYFLVNDFFFVVCGIKLILCYKVHSVSKYSKLCWGFKCVLL